MLSNQSIVTFFTNLFYKAYYHAH